MSFAPGQRVICISNRPAMEIGKYGKGPPIGAICTVDMYHDGDVTLNEYRRLDGRNGGGWWWSEHHFSIVPK